MGFDRIFARNRKRESVEARYLIFYFVKRYTKLSYQNIGEIARCFDIDRVYDHATIMHACKWVSDRKDVDKMFRFQIGRYNQQIQNSLHKSSELDNCQNYPEYLNELVYCLNERKEQKEVKLMAMYLRKIRDESSTTHTQENIRMEMV